MGSPRGVRDGSIERICTQHEAWPGDGPDDQPQGIYRGESLLGFLEKQRVNDDSTCDSLLAAHAEESAASSAPSPGAAPALVVPPEMQIHTFKVVAALSGALLASVNMPLAPPPTAGQLRVELERLEHRGNLVKLGGSDVLQDNEVFTGLAPGGESDIGLIIGKFIEVHEAGYYNGVYEQMDTNEGRPAFRMVKAHNARAGERYVYYSSLGAQIVPGWKFNDRYVPKVSEWDMLAPSGSGIHMDDDIPEGKFQLDN